MRLEVVLERKLYNSWIAQGSGNDSETGAIRDIVIGITEIWSIEDVEKFSPELPVRFTFKPVHRKLLCKCHVKVCLSRAVDHTGTHITEVGCEPVIADNLIAANA